MFAYEIFMARNAFETCLINSALWILVATNVGGSQGGQPVKCTGQLNRRSKIGRSARSCCPFSGSLTPARMRSG